MSEQNKTKQITLNWRIYNIKVTGNKTVQQALKI